MHTPQQADAGTASTDRSSDPLEVRLHVSEDAQHKLREVLAEEDAAGKWIRIVPQGIS